MRREATMEREAVDRMWTLYGSCFTDWTLELLDKHLEFLDS